MQTRLQLRNQKFEVLELIQCEKHNHRYMLVGILISEYVILKLKQYKVFVDIQRAKIVCHT